MTCVGVGGGARGKYRITRRDSCQGHLQCAASTDHNLETVIVDKGSANEKQVHPMPVPIESLSGGGIVMTTPHMLNQGPNQPPALQN